MVARFPESLRARRLNRLWRVHKKAEFQLRSEFGFGGGNPLTGNRDRGVEAVFYSPPLAYDWRVFAGAGHASGRFRSEEHTSELQSLMRISYAVFCLKKTTNVKT